MFVAHPKPTPIHTFNAPKINKYTVNEHTDFNLLELLETLSTHIHLLHTYTHKHTHTHYLRKHLPHTLSTHEQTTNIPSKHTHK